MEALEEKLGYRFTNRAFLENALTHSSYANENKAKGLQSNERLEFLGGLCAWYGRGRLTCSAPTPTARRGSDPHPGGPGV